MTTHTGNSGVAMIGANVIAEVTGYTINENADRLEDTALGDANKTYKAGDIDVGGTIDCWFDVSDTNGQEAMDVGAEVALVLRPYGTGSGLPTWTVTATILRQTSEVKRNQIISRSFEWGAAGALTKGTQ